jgi:hypothetical protein
VPTGEAYLNALVGYVTVIRVTNGAGAHQKRWWDVFIGGVG